MWHKARRAFSSFAGAMTKVDEYRRYAAECIALAQRREIAAEKARLLGM
jgi:hypothetical protein